MNYVATILAAPLSWGVIAVELTDAASIRPPQTDTADVP